MLNQTRESFVWRLETTQMKAPQARRRKTISPSHVTNHAKKSCTEASASSKHVTSWQPRHAHFVVRSDRETIYELDGQDMNHSYGNFHAKICQGCVHKTVSRKTSNLRSVHFETKTSKKAVFSRGTRKHS